MGNLKTDSPVARRIVGAFLDFLDNVEAAPGVDLEGLEVSIECLKEVFRLDSSPGENQGGTDSLVDIFTSLEASDRTKDKSHPIHKPMPVDAPSSSFPQNTTGRQLSRASKYSIQAENLTTDPNEFGTSKDELFGQYFVALEKNNFFKETRDGHDDPAQLDKATHLFHEALSDMEKSGCKIYNTNSLGESLKSLGNRAMQSNRYNDAIELYTCAISLCENSAVFYCNRAAAYTQIHKYAETVRDCYRSIEIDPNYSKAYSRLGLAYYAQGKFEDAMEKGFKKALQLDPNNESVKENIKVTEKKLNEQQQQQMQRNQNSSSSSYQSTGAAGSHGGMPSPFVSMSFNGTNIPTDFANMFTNIGGQQTQNMPQEHGNNSSTNQESGNQSAGESRNNVTPPPFMSMPFIGTGIPENLASMFMNMGSTQQTQNMEENGNTDTYEHGPSINVNFGEQMPEAISGALRSVMEMFSGTTPRENSHDTTNESSGANSGTN